MTVEAPAWFPSDLSSALDEKLGIEITDYDPEHVVARMPVAGNTQPYGLLHGGATCSLVETVGSYAAALNAGPGAVVVGIELNASYVQAATSGSVTAVCTPAGAQLPLSTVPRRGDRRPGPADRQRPADLPGQAGPRLRGTDRPGTHTVTAARSGWLRRRTPLPRSRPCTRASSPRRTGRSRRTPSPCRHDGLPRHGARSAGARPAYTRSALPPSTSGTTSSGRPSEATARALTACPGTPGQSVP